MKKSYAKYFAGLLLFGSNGIVASYIHLSSYEIVLLRAVLGGIFLLALFFITGHRFAVHQHKRDFAFIALSGIAMAADWLFLFEAFAEIGVSLGTLINYTGPAIVIALSPILLKEKLSRPKVAALAAALLGACLVSAQATASGINVRGLLCAIFSAVAYAIMVLSNKLVKNIKGTENAVLQLLCAAVAVAAFTCIKHGLSVEITGKEILPIVWLGLINTGIGCYCYFSSIGSLPAQSVAVCGYLEPLFAVLLSALVLHETMSFLQIVGAALIVGGAIFGECCHREKCQNIPAKSTAPRKFKSA